MMRSKGSRVHDWRTAALHNVREWQIAQAQAEIAVERLQDMTGAFRGSSRLEEVLELERHYRRHQDAAVLEQRPRPGRNQVGPAGIEPRDHVRVGIDYGRHCRDQSV